MHNEVPVGVLDTGGRKAQDTGKLAQRPTKRRSPMIRPSTAPGRTNVRKKYGPMRGRMTRQSSRMETKVRGLTSALWESELKLSRQMPRKQNEDFQGDFGARRAGLRQTMIPVQYHILAKAPNGVQLALKASQEAHLDGGKKHGFRAQSPLARFSPKDRRSKRPGTAKFAPGEASQLDRTREHMRIFPASSAALELTSRKQVLMLCRCVETMLQERGAGACPLPHVAWMPSAPGETPEGPESAAAVEHLVALLQVHEKTSQRTGALASPGSKLSPGLSCSIREYRLYYGLRPDCDQLLITPEELTLDLDVPSELEELLPTEFPGGEYSPSSMSSPRGEIWERPSSAGRRPNSAGGRRPNSAGGERPGFAGSFGRGSFSRGNESTPMAGGTIREEEEVDLKKAPDVLTLDPKLERKGGRPPPENTSKITSCSSSPRLRRPRSAGGRHMSYGSDHSRAGHTRPGESKRQWAGSGPHSSRSSPGLEIQFGGSTRGPNSQPRSPVDAWLGDFSVDPAVQELFGITPGEDWAENSAGLLLLSRKKQGKPGTKKHKVKGFAKSKKGSRSAQNLFPPDDDTASVESYMSTGGTKYNSSSNRTRVQALRKMSMHQLSQIGSNHIVEEHSIYTAAMHELARQISRECLERGELLHSLAHRSQVLMRSLYLMGAHEAGNQWRKQKNKMRALLTQVLCERDRNIRGWNRAEARFSHKMGLVQAKVEELTQKLESKTRECRTLRSYERSANEQKRAVKEIQSQMKALREQAKKAGMYVETCHQQAKLEKKKLNDSIAARDRLQSRVDSLRQELVAETADFRAQIATLEKRVSEMESARGDNSTGSAPSGAAQGSGGAAGGDDGGKDGVHGSTGQLEEEMEMSDIKSTKNPSAVRQPPKSHRETPRSAMNPNPPDQPDDVIGDKFPELDDGITLLEQVTYDKKGEAFLLHVEEVVANAHVGEEEEGDKCLYLLLLNPSKPPEMLAEGAHWWRGAWWPSTVGDQKAQAHRAKMEKVWERNQNRARRMQTKAVRMAVRPWEWARNFIWRCYHDKLQHDAMLASLGKPRHSMAEFVCAKLMDEPSIGGNVNAMRIATWNMLHTLYVYGSVGKQELALTFLNILEGVYPREVLHFTLRLVSLVTSSKIGLLYQEPRPPLLTQWVCLLKLRDVNRLLFSKIGAKVVQQMNRELMRISLRTNKEDLIQKYASKAEGKNQRKVAFALYIDMCIREFQAHLGKRQHQRRKEMHKLGGKDQMVSHSLFRKTLLERFDQNLSTRETNALFVEAALMSHPGDSSGVQIRAVTTLLKRLKALDYSFPCPLLDPQLEESVAADMLQYMWTSWSQIKSKVEKFEKQLSKNEGGSFTGLLISSDFKTRKATFEREVRRKPLPTMGVRKLYVLYSNMLRTLRSYLDDFEGRTSHLDPLRHLLADACVAKAAKSEIALHVSAIDVKLDAAAQSFMII